MRLFLNTVKRMLKPMDKMTDLEVVRSYLRYARDYNLPEEALEGILDTCIKILVEHEVSAGVDPLDALTEEDTLFRNSEHMHKVKLSLLTLLKEPDNKM